MLIKYNPNQEIKRRIKELYEQDNLHGLFAAGEDWIVIILAIVISEKINCLLIGKSALIYFGKALNYFLTILLIGCRQRALATLLHESAHNVLTKNCKLNYILGTVFGGWCIFQSWHVYRQTHVREHHVHLGDPDRDPDYQDLIRNNIYGENLSKRTFYIHLLKIVFDPTQTLSYIHYLFVNRMWNEKEDKKEFGFRIAFYLGATFFLVYYGMIHFLIWYWLIPLCTVANWVGAFLELSEHYPLLEVYQDRSELYLSRNRLGISKLGNFFLGIHEESWHLVHHLFPKVPFYHQAAAHEILLSDPEYRALQTTNGWTSIIKEMANMSEIRRQ